MKVHNFDQLSPEWWAARAGKPSSSNFDRIMTPKKRKASGSQEKYIAELIAERVCQRPNYFTTKGRPVSQAMQNGIDREPEARQWYEYHTGLTATRVGGCESDCGRFWASTDGLVGEEGVLELKVPELETHVAYAMKGILPVEYMCQVHGELIVTGRQWVDFVSYPVVPSDVPPLVIRVYPDDFTLALADALESFWERYQRAWEKLTGKRDTPPAATPEPDEYPLYDPMIDAYAAIDEPYGDKP